MTSGAFVLGAAILVVRLWARISHPGIFAEDGLVFYVQAEEIGAGAIWRPYAGYLHLVPRLGAALTAPFGLPAVPLMYLVYTLAVTLAVFALALRPQLDRVAPSAWGRGLAFLAICLVPQFWETSAVLASLIFVGGVGLLLLGLSRSPVSRAGRVAEILAVALLGLSGPLVAFYSPLYAYRWLRDRSRHNLLLLATVGLASVTQVAVFLGAGREAATHSFAYLRTAYEQRVVGELLTSASASKDAFATGSAFTIVAVVWLVAVVILVLVELGMRPLLGVAVTVFAFAWAVRTYDWLLLDTVYGDRHVLVPAVALLLITVGAFAAAVQRGWGRRSPALRSATSGDAEDGAPPALRRRLVGWPREVHRVMAAVGLASILMTIPGMWSGAAVPAWNHVPTQEELAAFQKCMDQGRRDCPPVKIAPKHFSIDPNHSWDPDSY